jgi:hypothetical protein
MVVIMFVKADNRPEEHPSCGFLLLDVAGGIGTGGFRSVGAQMPDREFFLDPISGQFPMPLSAKVFLDSAGTEARIVPPLPPEIGEGAIEIGAKVGVQAAITGLPIQNGPPEG